MLGINYVSESISQTKPQKKKDHFNMGSTFKPYCKFWSTLELEIEFFID